jgi:non-specific serine/threonine protein kinase
MAANAATVATNAATDPTPARSTERRTALFRKEGDYWRLGWEHSEFRLPDRVGLRHLATLIRDPGREFLAVDLVRASSGKHGSSAEPPQLDASIAELGRPRALASAEAMLDPHAERAYRARLAELRDVLAEARRNHDLGRIAEAERETEALTRELARSMGLGNRGRDSRSPIERARVSATRAIKAAIRLIEDHDASYGRHLGVTVKTGTFCAYVPDPVLTVTWRLDEKETRP